MSAAREPPFQFHLRHALIAGAVLCALLAIGTQIGAGVAVAVAGTGAFVVLAWRNGWRALAVLAPIVGWAGFALFLPAVQSRPVSPRSQCSNNLKQIGLAIQMYQNQYGCFPRAYVADAQGQRLHSWRTLILPFMEQSVAYEMIDLAAPWDAPQNQQISDARNPGHACPGEPHRLRNGTNYFAVVGRDAAWPGTVCARTSDFQDGLATTILVIEVAGADVPWAKPQDFTISEILAMLKSPRKTPGFGAHPTSFNALFADGSVRRIPLDIPPETLRALLTPSGGEKVRGY